MKTPSIHWPEKEDYEMAMESLNEKVHDPIIKHGKIHKDQTGTLRYGGANLYVTLYRIDNWMVRCFCRSATKEPPDDILLRYQHISNFCQNHVRTTPTLVPITYVDNAIEVDFFDRSGNSYIFLKTVVLPFVRMEFITGLALGSFIKVNYKQQTVMQELCNAWLRMVNDLKRIHMAHGDLDLTNVLVTQEPSGLVLKLIDYDNAWVPALHTKYTQTEVGHEHFQHPAFQSRNTRPYDEHMDNFSMLTMYISLKMLSLRPDLYTQEDWGPDDTHHLLLTRTDYEAEMNKKPNNITRLRNFHVKELDPLVKELSLSLQEKRQACNLTELLPEQTTDTIPYISSQKFEHKKTSQSPSSNSMEQEDLLPENLSQEANLESLDLPFISQSRISQPSTRILREEEEFIKADFYISYNKNAIDFPWARFIASILKEIGYTVILPHGDFKTGSNFAEHLQKAAKKARRTIIILSPAYLTLLKSQPKWINIFKRRTNGKNAFLLPICVQKFEIEFDDILNSIEYINIVGDDEATARSIVIAGIRDESINIDTNLFPSLSVNAKNVVENKYSPYNSSMSFPSIMQQIEIAFNKKDWSVVIHKTDAIISEYADLIPCEIYHMYGQALAENGNKQEAYQALKTSLSLASSDRSEQRINILKDYIKVLSSLNKWEDVIHFSNIALKLVPYDHNILVLQGEALFQINKDKNINQSTMLSQTEHTIRSALTNKPIEIFMSYSHYDERLREMLLKQLHTMRRHGPVNIWHDCEIRPGGVWDQEIHSHLKTASIILLLVSPDFIKSNYCYSVEMEQAMKRHKEGNARVIPIILRPTDLEGTPIEKLQALPKKAKPVTTWNNRESAFLEIVKGIREVIVEISEPYK